MTLYKLLSEMDNDKKIKMGAVDGSSYFYVGTVGDILDNWAYYSDRIRKETVKRADLAFKTYRRMMRSDPASLSAYFRDREKAGIPTDTPEDDFIDFVRSVYRLLKLRRDRYRERKTDMDNYIPFRNREVVRAFEADKIADEGVFCIVIEGKEQGRFWLHGEGGENHLAFYHGNADIIE